ncbi:MAG: AGE family epimerase/isomerase [Candidatus Methylumidiphilus sp.]
MAIMRVWLVSVFCMLALLLGCDSGLMPAAKIDADWHRQQLLDGVLPHWLTLSPTANGYMAPAFSRDWHPIPGTSTSLIFQARAIYAFASGYEVSSDKRYRDAALSGADFLLEHFHDAEFGGWYKAVAPDGKVVDDGKETYGHAFAIFALAHVYSIAPEPRFRDAALEGWRVLKDKMRDPTGGFRRSAPRNFVVAHELRTQNPIMHLFEAMLAFYHATASEEALAAAESVGDFVLNTLLRRRPDGSAYIEEWYDENWIPLADGKGGYTDLGHQFEWAYLLSRAGSKGFAEAYSEAAQSVLDFALGTGYDNIKGGAFFKVSGTGSVDQTKGYWQQSECLRALMHFMVVRGKTGLRPRYEQTLQYVTDEWIDDVNGGWLGQPKSVCATAGCAGDQPDPYHMTAMHMEALELAVRQIEAK